MWLVRFRYEFGKNCGWSLCVIKICIKCLVEIYKTQLKKYVKTISQKIYFKLNFLVSPAVQNQFGLLSNTLLCLLQTQKQLRKKHSLKFHNLHHLLELCFLFPLSFCGSQISQEQDFSPLLNKLRKLDCRGFTTMID